MLLGPCSNRVLSLGVQRHRWPTSAFHLWNFGNGWELSLALSRAVCIRGIYVRNIWLADGPAVPVIARTIS
jgi:hypothetical protein